jgi:pimeloyl-ACP methyl ester carboxylesterase
VTLSRLVPGTSLLLAVGAAVIRSGSAILAGHWAYLVWLVVVGLLGLLLVIWAFRGSPRAGGVRGVLRWSAAAAGVGLAAVTFWLAPYPADPIPPAAASSSTGILLEPDSAVTTGIAFLPGALVDPRAYQSIFAPIVEAGYPVYIAKPPFGIAFSVPDVVAAARTADPQVQQWVVAGHSLGGAVASGQTGDAAGLILLAAFPIDDISETEVPVLSVSGSDDALSTPADIEANASKLPPDTRYVVVEGGTHAFFGDYGQQRGDGRPGVSREVAQAQIQQAMIDFLAGIPAPSGRP